MLGEAKFSCLLTPRLNRRKREKRRKRGGRKKGEKRGKEYVLYVIYCFFIRRRWHRRSPFSPLPPPLPSVDIVFLTAYPNISLRCGGNDLDQLLFRNVCSLLLLPHSRTGFAVGTLWRIQQIVLMSTKDKTGRLGYTIMNQYTATASALWLEIWHHWRSRSSETHEVGKSLPRLFHLGWGNCQAMNIVRWPFPYGS